MEAPEIEARVQIHALLAAHANRGDAGDIQSMIGLYAPGATYELPNGTIMRGAQQMKETLGGAASESTADGWGLEYMRHHLTTSRIELVSDTEAHSDSYFVNINNRGLDHWGRWEDTFVKQDGGGWRFSRRTVIVEGSLADSWFETASGLG